MYRQFASLKTTETKLGSVLLAYIVDPFLLPDYGGVSRKHTNQMESVTIAESFLGLGYDVDIIDYRNATFNPQKDYKFFVSARTNFSKISERLSNDCIKIAHLDTAHFLFNNSAAYGRLLAMQDRRGATASSLKVIEKNWAPEFADYLAILGNEFTLDTYRYAKKKMFRLPVPTSLSYPAPTQKDFDSCNKRYLWLGSAGLVHKGLDLTLEAFRRMSDYHLTVCGSVDATSEREFRKIYYKELYETDNIDTVGWIDVGSTKFLEIASRCTGLVYPSCSEGQSGAVVTCMAAGLIPIVSYESGVDIDNFGVMLKDCTVDQITESVMRLSSTAVSELSDKAENAWTFARDHHTLTQYRVEYQQMINSILAEQSDQN